VIDSQKQDAIAVLFRQAHKAHHDAYLATDGADPDWPLWYADYLHQPLAALLGASFTRSELVYLLVTLDGDIKRNAPGADWAVYYARWLLSRYA